MITTQTPQIEVNLLPLSTNNAYIRRPRKSAEYRQYEEYLPLLLPKELILPPAPYRIRFIFYINKGGDYDNPIKQTQDIIAKYYNFNDKDIYEALITKVPTSKKEDRRFIFQILHYDALNPQHHW